MALKSKLRSFRRFIPLASALLLAALLAIPASNIALAQTPPGDEITLVNADREFVERKGGGEFVARPVFDREIADLFYAVRDADTGDWISAMYRVKGREGAQRRLGVLVGVPRPGRAARPRPRQGVPVGDAGRRRGRQAGRVLQRHSLPRAGPHLGQDPLRPQPGALGEGLRRLGWSRESTAPSAASLKERPARTPTTAGAGSR